MIIALSGKIASGKDTLADMIQYHTFLKQFPEVTLSYEQWCKNTPGKLYWENVKFAGKLKQMVCLLIGCTMEDLESQEFKHKELGSEWWGVKAQIEMLDGFGKRYYHNKLFNSGDEYFYAKSDSSLFYGETVTFLDHEEFKLTPRLILQLLGTEAGRNIIHPNIWVNATMADYKPNTVGKKETFRKFSQEFEQELDIRWPNWLITDLRFPNEAESIKSREGILIRIERDIHLRTPYKDIDDFATNATSEDKAKYLHASETSLDSWNSWDYTVFNNQGLEQLLNTAKNIVEDLYNQKKIL